MHLKVWDLRFNSLWKYGMEQWLNRPLMCKYFMFILLESRYEQRISWCSKTHAKKFPYGETPYGELILRRNFRTAKYLYGEISYGEISLRRNFLTAKFFTAKFPTAKFLTAKFPVTVVVRPSHHRAKVQGSITRLSLHSNNLKINFIGANYQLWTYIFRFSWAMK